MQGAERARKRPSPARGELAVWRSNLPESIDEEMLDRIEQALRDGPLRLMHPRWPAAARGDASVAVGVALDNLGPQVRVGATATDLAMTAILPHACRGNPAAVLVLTHALAALARKDPGGEAHALASRWAARGARVGLTS